MILSEEKKINVDKIIERLALITISALGITFITIIVLTIVSSFSEPSNIETEIVYFETIGTDHLGGKIMVDKNTGVLYYSSPEEGLTPLYNSDGSLKLYKGDDESDE